MELAKTNVLADWGLSGLPPSPLISGFDSSFYLRANLANKVLLAPVANVAPLVPWAPLDWLDPLASLDVR